MADLEHLRILKQGRRTWNRWRRDHFETRPDLVTANLYRGVFNGADLSEADMTASNLKDSMMRGVNLTKALLLYANLTSSDLRSADFTGANLARATLTWANLQGAILLDADLKGSDLGKADLSDADLRGARNVTLRQLSRAVVNRNTRLPRYLFSFG